MEFQNSMEWDRVPDEGSEQIQWRYYLLLNEIWKKRYRSRKSRDWMHSICTRLLWKASKSSKYMQNKSKILGAKRDWQQNRKNIKININKNVIDKN